MGITKINIKPLSINKSFIGRRFKTKEHNEWRSNLIRILPPKKDINFPVDPPYEIYLKFGFSSRASDWDNCIKNFQDALADRYNFNDKFIRRGVVETEIVKKGQEYCCFEILSLTK